MTLFPATGPQAGISAPSSRRGQTEAAIGHLRFEGDMGRELPRSIWEAAGRREEEEPRQSLTESELRRGEELREARYLQLQGHYSREELFSR